MNRIDRLLGMLTLLQSKKYVPAEKIAEKFSISIRTVYRDVKALCEQGIPISFEANKGYFVVQGYFLPPVAFTTEEANALLLMEQMIGAFGDQSIRVHYSNALNKVKSVLRHHQKEKIERLQQQTYVQMPSCFIKNFEYLTVVQQAISDKHVLEMEYGNRQNEISRRCVEPIGLVFYALNWHLIAWCHRRMEYRDFKIGRILRVTNTCQPFSKARHIELREYLKQLPVAY
jgi:predicted DNA-binding transcriptional regulator YafY